MYKFILSTIILVLILKNSFSQETVFDKPLIENSYWEYLSVELLKVELSEKETIAYVKISVNGTNMIQYNIPSFKSENAFILIDNVSKRIYKQAKNCKINKKTFPVVGNFDFMPYDEYIIKLYFEKIESTSKELDLLEGEANRRNYEFLKITGIKLYNEVEKTAYLKNIEIEKQKKKEEQAIALQRQLQINEEAQKKENERLQILKIQIENGTFNGSHFYNYDGYKYTGSFINGTPNGQGKWEKPDGSWYEGQFKNGVENGIGTLRQSSGLRYTGNFTDGVPNGNFKIEQWTLMGLSRNEWQAEYKNGKLISSSQTNDGMDKLFSSGSSTYSNNTNQNNSNGNSNSKTPTEYKIPEVKKIEFEQTKSSFVMGESEKYFITYKDGVTGYLLYSKKYQQWYINNSTTDFAYDTKNNALAALYEYKDKGSIRKIGRKN